MQTLIAEIVEQAGRIDLVVNNAGIGLHGAAEETSIAQPPPSTTRSPSPWMTVIIIGGSFAGLAGALQLGRARRKVTVLDTGLPRNRFAGHSHGLLGHDHKPPLDILAEAPT